MFINDKLKREAARGTDFPRFKGHVKMVLHNCMNHKDEFVFEKHNDPTNALSDIFANNYGGLVDYDNFADLYKTWLGGVLVFAGTLDTSSAGWADDYGIPARTSNECVAHAGQTPIGEAPYDQADDTTRGNPDNAGIVKTVGSTKMCWEWGTSAGNAPVISSLGLTHTDVGSYGCGVASETQKLLSPFAEIGCKSRSYAYGNDGVTPLGINGNIAYSFYLESATSLKIYKTPINKDKYKLQGGSLLPLTAYTETVSATLTSCTRNSAGDCYYWFDFANNKLILFRVVTEGGDDVYKDTIDLDTGNVVHDAIEVTGAQLWKFNVYKPFTSDHWFDCPTRAIIYHNRLFLYGWDSQGAANTPNKMYIYNLSNGDVDEVDTQLFSSFITGSGANTRNTAMNSRFAMLGGIIANSNFLINGDKIFPTNPLMASGLTNHNYALPEAVSSPVFGLNASLNMVSANKLYLATKWNLDSAVAKTSAMSMRVEYTLTEV